MRQSAPRDGRAGIDAGLVRHLLRRQFPQWSGLAVRPVARDGWDNRTYRLGAALSVRLPTAAGYGAAVEKERIWLLTLAPHLPVAIPEVVATGAPDCGYRHPRSVRLWIEGERADVARLEGSVDFARMVADFARALHAIEPADGPVAGAHSFHRGADLRRYDAETRESLGALAGRIDTGRARAVWEAGLAATWAGAAVWFHGDIVPGNLLVRDGKLAAVIDFGTSGVGDPACDLVIAWAFFHGAARAAFLEAVAPDRGMAARGRAWALWKAVIVLRAALDAGEGAAERESRATLAALLGGAD